MSDENPDEEIWECPICKKSVMVGQMIHKYCLEGLIAEFLQYVRDQAGVDDYGNYLVDADILIKWLEGRLK